MSLEKLKKKYPEYVNKNLFNQVKQVLSEKIELYFDNPDNNLDKGYGYLNGFYYEFSSRIKTCDSVISKIKRKGKLEEGIKDLHGMKFCVKREDLIYLFSKILSSLIEEFDDLEFIEIKDKNWPQKYTREKLKPILHKLGVEKGVIDNPNKNSSKNFSSFSMVFKINGYYFEIQFNPLRQKITPDSDHRFYKSKGIGDLEERLKFLIEEGWVKDYFNGKIDKAIDYIKNQI